MNLSEWMNTQLTGVVARIEQSILSIHTEGGLNLACRHDVYEVVDDLLAVLFPGCHSTEKILHKEMNFFLNDKLRHISFKLSKHINGAFHHHCLQENCVNDRAKGENDRSKDKNDKAKDDNGRAKYESSRAKDESSKSKDESSKSKDKNNNCSIPQNCNCEEKADQALIHLIESLPQIHTVLVEDIRAAYEGDPAAKCIDEIILSYPCVEAIATYRIAHQLYELDVPIIPRIMSERAHSRTGIDIHPGARIAPAFFIDHGTGVVIGETCTIGRNVKIYQGVTLGALSPFDQQGNPRRGVKRHPDVEDDVIIYANATVLGGETVIGRGAVIGGNTWITKSVPPGAHVYNRSREEVVERDHNAP